MPDIISVRFRSEGKQYYFDPQGETCRVGDGVIVETAAGKEYAVCVRGNFTLPEEELTFTLSESEHPRSPKLSLPFKPVFLLAGIVGFALIGGGVIAVVLIIKRKKSREKEQP